MYGQLGSAFLNEQQSYGTVFSGSLSNLPIIRETLEREIEDIAEANMRDRFGEPPHHIGVFRVSGNVEFEPLPIPIGYILRAACGQSSATLVTSMTQHKFQPRRNSDFDERSALPPHTIIVERDVGSAEAYGDLVANELSLEIANSELLKANVEFIGSGLYSSAAIPSAAQPTGAPFTWDVTSVSFGGEPLLELSNLRVGHVNNVVQRYTLSSSKYARGINRDGFVEVRGEGTMTLTSSVHSKLTADFAAKTKRQLLINFRGISSGDALRVDVPQCFLESFSPQISGPERLEVDFSFIGEYDTTSGYAIEYMLTNTATVYGPAV